ncbi:hypothetical protein DL95DRAFT_465633 [Leptodontidium sp. 2 PMI_412]|nr:hypothetical protein DL95DRAFT_465633 [Leptodontidium sp. 2 PMI_412]
MAAPKPYITSMSRASNPGTIGGDRNRRNNQAGASQARKRKADQGPKFEPESQRDRIVREIENLVWDRNTPIGTGDFPSGAVVSKVLNKDKACMIVASPTGPPQRVLPLLRARAGRLDICSKATTHRWLSSRETGRSESVEVPTWSMVYRQGTDVDPVFFEEFKGTTMEPLTMAKQMEDIYSHAEISAKIQTAISEFGTIQQNLSQAFGKQVDDQKVADLVEEFNVKKPIFTLIRKTQSVEQAVDVAFMHRCRVVADQGLCPFFREHIGSTLGLGFKEWFADPTKLLPHQPWNQKIEAPDGD